MVEFFFLWPPCSCIYGHNWEQRTNSFKTFLFFPSVHLTLFFLRIRIGGGRREKVFSCSFVSYLFDSVAVFVSFHLDPIVPRIEEPTIPRAYFPLNTKSIRWKSMEQIDKSLWLRFLPNSELRAVKRATRATYQSGYKMFFNGPGVGILSSPEVILACRWSWYSVVGNKNKIVALITFLWSGVVHLLEGPILAYFYLHLGHTERNIPCLWGDWITVRCKIQISFDGKWGTGDWRWWWNGGWKRITWKFLSATMRGKKRFHFTST